MSCCGGCGGAGGGGSAPSGPILSGVLESRYADASPTPPLQSSPEVATAGVLDGLSSGGFWVVLLFIGVAAYWTDKAKRESE